MPFGYLASPHCGLARELSRVTKPILRTLCSLIYVFCTDNMIGCVTKHCSGPKYRSFRDLFMQICDVIQQPAGMAVPKCINRQPHRALQRIYLFCGNAGTFVPKDFCPQGRKFHRVELSFPETFVHGNFRSRGRKFHGTKVPWRIYSHQCTYWHIKSHI